MEHDNAVIYNQVTKLLTDAGYTERDIPNVMMAMAEMSLGYFVAGDVAEQLENDTNHTTVLNYLSTQCQRAIAKYGAVLGSLSSALSAYRVLTCLENSPSDTEDIDALRSADLFGSDLISADLWADIIDNRDSLMKLALSEGGGFGRAMAAINRAANIGFDEIDSGMRKRIHDAANLYRAIMSGKTADTDGFAID